MDSGVTKPLYRHNAWKCLQKRIKIVDVAQTDRQTDTKSIFFKRFWNAKCERKFWFWRKKLFHLPKVNKRLLRKLRSEKKPGKREMWKGDGIWLRCDSPPSSCNNPYPFSLTVQSRFQFGRRGRKKGRNAVVGTAWYCGVNGSRWEEGKGCSTFETRISRTGRLIVLDWCPVEK